MKRWQLITLNLGATIGLALAGKYLPPKTADAIAAITIPAVAAVTDAASKRNPDGTPAEEPYKPKAKAKEQ